MLLTTDLCLLACYFKHVQTKGWLNYTQNELHVLSQQLQSTFMFAVITCVNGYFKCFSNLPNRKTVSMKA